MSYRIGIDIGGTFTDFVLVDDKSGKFFIHKQLTTPSDPSKSVLSGIPALLGLGGVDLQDVSGVVHGTTLVTNAVIERRGSKCGMICTQGFESVLDIAHERRYDLYDLRIEYAKPLVPRQLRTVIDERVNHRGEITRKLKASEVRHAVENLCELGITSLAVCLLNSYTNDVHEICVREIAKEVNPSLYVTTSAEVFPYMREYERWTTATINAYAQPIVDRYLDRLEKGLESLGFNGSFHMMTSSGGAITPELARRFPVRLLESGPAAGILMAAVAGKNLGEANLLAFDMGGTTAKGALVRNGAPLKRYDLEIDHAYKAKKGSGLTVKTPVIDLIEIGSGGGSIAEIDARGVIQVGPRSAGADPGPACYQLGGDRLTVTDANLILGYLNGDYFLGGEMSLSSAASREAAKKISAEINVDILRAAWGVHETASEDIARAFRNHASERGFDYRKCAMVASGGAGPTHATRVARKLRVPKVIFTAGAGAMSAFGLLACPLSFELSQSKFVAFEALTADDFTTTFENLKLQAANHLIPDKKKHGSLETRCWIDMCYRGQGYNVEVELPRNMPMAQIFAKLPELFAETYRGIFFTDFAGEEMDVASWKVEVSAPTAGLDSLNPVTNKNASDNAIKGKRPAFFPDMGNGFADYPVYDRYALKPGDRFTGPALIEERETTYVIGSGDEVLADDGGNLIVTIVQK